MEARLQLKRNYRARYWNTERQVADIQPGENILKYIKDCFATAAREHPVLSPSLSTSSCSSPDLNQDHFPPPSEKKKSRSSVLVNSDRRAFSTTCSKAQLREASSSGGSVFLPDSPSEDEMSIGSPALLVEEQAAPRDPDVALPHQNGTFFLSSAAQAPPSPLPWNTAGSELESEDEFLIAESFGAPSTSWLLQPKKNNLLKERSITSPRLENDKAAKERSIGNVRNGAHVPVEELGNSFSKQPQSIVPAALQSPTSKQLQKQKCPKNVPPKKRAGRPRKNIRSSARDAGRKHRVLVLEKSSESEPKELCVRKAKTPPQDRLTPLRKRSAHVSQMFLVSPEDEHGRALTQEGPREAGKAFLSMEQQNSRTPSARCSFVRAINMNDLSGPVCNQNDKASFECEIKTRGNMGDSFLVRSPDNPTYLRRSKRLRLKPLEYWRGERVMYKMEPSGGLAVSGILSPQQEELRKCNKIKQPVQMDIGKILGSANAALKDPSQPAHVFDAASKQEVLQECVSSGRSHCFINEDLSIYKYLSTPLFSAGKLILNPFKEKGSQYSHTDTLVFHIVKGRLLFTLYGQYYSLGAGNYFFVPAGNIYNIQNVLNEECILFFTQIKGNRSEGE